MKLQSIKSRLILQFLAGTLLLATHFAEAQGVPDSRIFSTFRQGERGNCASVALIKAAMNVYGIGNVFQEERIADTLWRITTKNNSQYYLSSRELRMAATSADFRLEDSNELELYRYAVRCYAVMGKVREDLDQSEDIKNYADALEALEAGAYTPTVFRYLGLENKINAMYKWESTANKCGVVAWRSKHAVFACYGYMDNHGDKEGLSARYYGRFQLLP